MKIRLQFTEAKPSKTTTTGHWAQSNLQAKLRSSSSYLLNLLPLLNNLYILTFLGGFVLLDVANIYERQLMLRRG